MYSYGAPHMAVQKQDDQLELTYSNYVRTQDVTLKTCWRRWMIGRSGERGSGISVLVARHDDDDYSLFPLFSIAIRVFKRTLYVYSKMRGAFNKFPDFFVQAFKIVVDSWKFSMLLLYILWDDWPIFMISGSRQQLQQQLEYTLLKPDCYS